MKKSFKTKYYLMLAGLLVLGLASCRKEYNGEIAGGKGAPAITSIRTLNKTTNDTVSNTYTTYDDKGVPSQSTQQNPTTHITALDSTTNTGKLGNYYVIQGKNLGSTTNISLNGVNVYFNRALSSDNSVIFSIPSNIPYVQPQSNTLKLVTLYGSVTYNFTTLPPPPTISALSDYNFTANSTISLKGQGFAAVTAIKLQTGGATVNIVSKNDSIIVLQMPATTASRSKLLFAYTSGTQTLQAGSTVEFVDLDNNMGGTVFANGAWGTATTGGNSGAWGDASWQGPSGYSATAPSISGKGGLITTYPSNGWKIEGWANWYPGFSYDPAYKFLTFWVKGGKQDHTLNIEGDLMPSGYNQNSDPTAYAITVPANVWTYFKIPILAPNTPTSNVTGINFWYKDQGATPAKQLGFFLKGASTDPDETLYFDQVVFVK